MFPGFAVLDFGTDDVPDKWHEADGSFVSKSQFSLVFGRYGHRFNGNVDPGDGTFKLPTARDLFVIGAGGTYQVGDTGGAATVTLTAAQSGLPAHGHALTDPGHNHTIDDGGTGFVAATPVNLRSPTTGTITSSVVFATDVATTGITLDDAAAAPAAEAHTNLPPFVAARVLIYMGQ